MIKFLNKIPARSTTLLLMVSILSYTFIQVLWFLILSVLIGFALFYVAMKLRGRYKNKKDTVFYKSVFSILILGDVYLNFTVCIVLFNQWYTPSATSKFGWLVTDRLIWNKNNSKGYRSVLSYKICRILNRRDANHC